MTITNQDRTDSYEYNRQTCLYVMPIIHKTQLMGFNLYLDGEFLGTFDSLQECIQEITQISRCKTSYYCITGYSTWDIVEHMMLEED